METKRQNGKIVKYIIGVDEAGRGPLAGPITVGALMAPGGFRFMPLGGKTALKDSKRLSEIQREAWFRYLRGRNDIAFAVSSVSAAVIDRIGISRATRLAVSRAVRRLFWTPSVQKTECEVVLDGLLRAPAKYKQRTITHGDSLVPVIAAASVVAKVTRDRKMKRLHKKYPEYGFAEHKGYGTAAHYRALKKHGLSPEHRCGYCETFLV